VQPPRTVLYLHSSAGRYGADRQLALLATGLDPARYRALVVLAMDGELREDLQSAGVEVLVRPLAVMRRAAMSPGGLAGIGVALARDAGGLARLARRRDVALIHTNTSVTLGGAGASRVARIPHVWHLREIYTGFERYWPAYRRMLLTADALPCVSGPTCAQLGGDPRALVVHDGLAVAPHRAPRDEARDALDLPRDAFVCAILGRISAWKGQDVLIRALADPALAPAAAAGPGDRGAPPRGKPAAADAIAIVLVAGDPWQGEERRLDDLHALAAELGVSDRVRFVGFRSDVENVYGAADVVCVPSTQPDPLPNAALEAAAAGCCVVAANHGGLPEMISDEATGLLVAPGDPAALATALARLRADPQLRERLGAAAAVDVRERFAPARLLERTQALYDDVIQRRAA
jgi:glycosyltransferase involved in cell wall biosynthesis